MYSCVIIATFFSEAYIDNNFTDQATSALAHETLH